MDEILNITFSNTDHCVVVNDILEYVQDESMLIYDQGSDNVVVVVVIFIASCCMLLVGGRIAKPLVVTGAIIASFYALYILSDTSATSCDFRIIMATCISLVVGVIIACMFRVTLFIIGGTCVALTVHIAFIVFPELNTLETSIAVVEDKSIIYWGAMGTGILLGGALFLWRHHVVLQIFTSAVGGLGIAYGIHSVAEENVPSIALVAVAIITTTVGAFFQHTTRNNSICRKKAHTHRMDEQEVSN